MAGWGQELVGRSQVCACNIKFSVTVTQPWPLWVPLHRVPRLPFLHHGETYLCEAGNPTGAVR